jgi:hypothetical protein
MAWSIQYTWVFNNTKGSVLLAAVIHGAVNAWTGYFALNRLGFSGISVYIALFGIVSIIIVLLAGPAHLSRTNKRNVVGSESEPAVRAASPARI